MIAYFAHAEVGWIAWGSKVSAPMSSDATIMLTAAYLPPSTDKIATSAAVRPGPHPSCDSPETNRMQMPTTAPILTDEQMIATLADETVRDLQAKGKKVVFPAGKTLEDATTQADYPPAIWKAAAQRWAALGPAKQKERREAEQQQYAAVVGAVRGALHERAFAESFSPYDILWFILAAGTAFRLGAGNVGSEDD